MPTLPPESTVTGLSGIGVGTVGQRGQLPLQLREHRTFIPKFYFIRLIFKIKWLESEEKIEFGVDSFLWRRPIPLNLKIIPTPLLSGAIYEAHCR